MNITFQQNSLYARESPITVAEGTTITLAANYWDTPSTVSAAVKRKADQSDVTSTVMPSGSVSISGNVATLKPLVIASGGGYTYTVNVTGTVAGDVWVKKMDVIVRKAGE